MMLVLNYVFPTKIEIMQHIVYLVQKYRFLGWVGGKAVSAAIAAVYPLSIRWVFLQAFRNGGYPLFAKLLVLYYICRI